MRVVPTSERRTELAALLADESRWVAEYPKVAEYRNTAPMLSGSGNREADTAFDLRFTSADALRLASLFVIAALGRRLYCLPLA